MKAIGHPANRAEVVGFSVDHPASANAGTSRHSISGVSHPDFHWAPDSLRIEDWVFHTCTCNSTFTFQHFNPSSFINQFFSLSHTITTIITTAINDLTTTSACSASCLPLSLLFQFPSRPTIHFVSFGTPSSLHPPLSLCPLLTFVLAFNQSIDRPTDRPRTTIPPRVTIVLSPPLLLSTVLRQPSSQAQPHLPPLPYHRHHG